MPGKVWFSNIFFQFRTHLIGRPDLLRGCPVLHHRSYFGFYSKIFLATLIKFAWLIKTLIYQKNLAFLRYWLGGFLNCLVLLMVGFMLEVVFTWIWLILPVFHCSIMEHNVFHGYAFERIKCFTEDCLLFRIDLW